MDVTPERLLDVGFDAVEAAAPPAPAPLAARVATAATSARPAADAGWSAGNGRLTALQAFLQTATEVADMLDALSPADWSRGTGGGAGQTVHDMAVHLVGVERYLLGQLGVRAPFDAPERRHHTPATRQAAAELLDEPGPIVARTWWREVLAVAAACGRAGPDRPVQYHDIPGTVRSLMTIRTFEVWTHGEDITRAVGLGRNPLDGPRLALMSGELIAVLPFALALSGQARPGATARLELTGPGGGEYLVPLALGEVPGEPAVTITTPVIDICRLAANRIAAADLPVSVTGDVALVEPVLVAAGALAMD
ncbi:MAG TPA: maleylpyruvate isomerase family mycothiol-dependent enzyme [Acidimicrobiales bacterium]|nr:maleylpyruvate isomerase family mycothiol-dependent enzyme [Acidimicrobiales bacterium]